MPGLDRAVTFQRVYKNFVVRIKLQGRDSSVGIVTERAGQSGG
jgi:hypothetical protein